MPYVPYQPDVITYNFPSILLIDDDADDRYLFQEALAEAVPFASLCCLSDGDELLEALKRPLPALIFIDYKLPKEDGVEYVRQIKAHPVFSKIPVIMWSSSSILQHVLAAYQAGVQLFFEKPWEIKVLVQKLKSIILGPDAGPIPAKNDTKTAGRDTYGSEEHRQNFKGVNIPFPNIHYCF